MEAGAVDIVQTGCVWGIAHFLRVAVVAHSRDLPISPVGYLTNPVTHAAACVPSHLSTEVQDLSSPFGLTVDQINSDGGIVLGDTPGIGISVDEVAIGAAKAVSGWSALAGPHVRPDRAWLRLIPEQWQPRGATATRRGRPDLPARR